MKRWKYKFQMYKFLEQNKDAIYKEAIETADEIGIPQELRGKFGLTGAVSGCHGLLSKKVAKAMEDTAREVIPNKNLDEEVREIIKDIYGDKYDGAMISTCEAALWVAFDVLATPPMQGRGDNYRTRYIAPYERHMHHQAGYGRPFPGKYKDLYADRGCTAGEFGFYGKRQNNLDVIIVPLVGANYDVHGIKSHPAVLLTGVDPDASIKKISKVANDHASMLTGCTSLGYDTPGYGYGVKDEEGIPRLQKLLGQLAQEYNIPYIVDNAWGLPAIGTDPRKIGADIIVYSMDKAIGGPTAGLIIGKEDVMVDIRRALGIHGERWGTGLSHGKATYVTVDPGKEALLGGIAALKILRDEPKVITEAVDKLYEIVKEEFSAINDEFKKDLIISKSSNSATVEINYENTWKENRIGIPIFPIEDFYAGTELIKTSLIKMGIIPTITYDGNIFISLGLGTTDEEGRILEGPVRYGVKGLIKVLEIVSKYAGINII